MDGYYQYNRFLSSLFDCVLAMTNQLSPETLRIDMDEEIPSSKPKPIEPENEIIKPVSLEDLINIFNIFWLKRPDTNKR